MIKNAEHTPPTWVRWVVVTFVALLLVGAAAMLFAGGQHGPWRHMQGTEQPAG